METEAGAGMNEQPSSEEIVAAAIALEAASKSRSLARSTLAKLRKAWIREYEMYYSKEECEKDEGAAEMEAALKARVESQRAFSAARSRLFRAVRRAK